ncbi:MAG TPA: phosphoribosyltransferase family protein, partial [Pseudomonadota bacterium]|nr:phosphoribosyltransferase family protein [Pseudomonadota bacterium]
MAETASSKTPVLTTLFSAEQIAARIAELGEQIARDYDGKDVTLLGVLKGSFVFYADLARQVFLAQKRLGLRVGTVNTEFLAVQSYGDATTTSGVVQITADLTRPVEGRHLLIVEDIVDTGLTMRYL